jgi:flavin reductase (DIM6/NTAB) family NADH-FMN oxidoreductase RutF
MFYEPQNGHGLPHDPFTSLVVPRPIGWISTISAEGIPNLAPYSFFNAICGRPPMVGFSSEGLKDTANNILATGEFVVNLATDALAEAMNLSSALLPSQEDEFVFAGLESAAGKTVKAPRVALAPAALECKLVSITQINTIDGVSTGNRHIIGQVTGIHIADEALVDGLFDVAAAGIIARLGYRNYARINDIFSMIRPDPHHG